MVNGDQYVLNDDFWAPMQKNDDGVTRVVGRFSKGDVLEGVTLSEELITQGTKGVRPMLLKKNSKEARTLRGEPEPQQEEDKSASTVKK